LRAIVTVSGFDKVGIIANVSAVLAQYGANILDINQTVMQGIFTMVTLIDVSKTSVPFNTLKEALSEKGEEIGLSIRIQREDIFEAMHRI
jgi:ACT domain-containing protein